MTRYQLEIVNPLGQWVKHGPPARSMTAAILVGLRLVPARDLRVVAIDSGEVVHRDIVGAAETEETNG